MGRGLDDTKVIKDSQQANVKSGSNSDLLPCQPGVQSASMTRSEHGNFRVNLTKHTMSHFTAAVRRNPPPPQGRYKGGL